MKKVLILGGYGNFGTRLCTTLAKDNIAIIIAGRQQHAADQLAQSLRQQFPTCPISTAIFDAQHDLTKALTETQASVVINTCGPFQGQNYAIANTCIKQHCHYIDLADAREFVSQISQLDSPAVKAGVSVISGASTVPGLSSAVLDHFTAEFSTIESLRYGITPGQKTTRGLATTQSILSYLGKAMKPAPNSNAIRYGWQDIYRQHYPELGYRWMANCDIPDIDLLPTQYQLKEIQFSAGMESSLLHLGMWLASWLVRLKLPLKLQRHARSLLQFSHWFDPLGTADGGMHMIIKGHDEQRKKKTITWFLIAKDGHGPQIPITPAVILTKKLLQQPTTIKPGARACVGEVSLNEYLNALSELHIQTYTHATGE